MSLKVKLLDYELKNPLIAASGCFGFGREYNSFYDVGVWGAIATKGLTLLPRQGNDAPRVAETASGVLNSVGLQNPGVEAFIAHDLPFLEKSGALIFANIAGSTLDDYIEIAARLDSTSVHFLELNISCPNVKEGGIAFGVEPSSVERVTRAVKSATKKPVIVKLTPNVSDITKNALAAEAGGADGVSLINTLGGMAVDFVNRKPILKNVFGGLSGAAIKPVALKMVWQVYNAVKIPIIGMGGISNASDILEFLLCGSQAVMVGTHNFTDPNAPINLLNELTNLVEQYKIDIGNYIGSLKI